MGQNDGKPILLFDGVCGLCNRFVDFVLRKDTHARVMLTPLQGETAKAKLPENLRSTSLDTFVLIDDKGTYVRSTAVLRAVAHMGGMWTMAKILLIVPRFIRDAVYNFVARNRYQWFGKRDACRLPTPEERARFLP